MKTYQAQVHNGRLIMDEPTQISDGTVLRLVIADEGDDLDEQERAQLHHALDESWAAVQKGQTRPVEEILRELDTSRGR